MHFKPAQCPSCAGSLQVPDDRTTVNCMYCGATIVVREAIQAAASATVPNLLKLARAAAQSSNHQEAYDYFTRVLEIDGDNSEAWAGKAEVTGKMSGQHSFRMPEMITYFRNAIEVAGDDQREQIEERVAQVICRLVSEDYSKMRSGLSPDFWEGATWNFYLNRVRQLMTVLEDAHELIPRNSSIIKAFIWLCDENSKGVQYRSKGGQRARRQFDPKWNALINDKSRQYTEKLYTLNPSLRPAPVIVTNSATMPISRNFLLIALGGFLLIGLILVLIAVAVNQSETRTANTADTRTDPTTSPTKSTSSLANPSTSQVTPGSTALNFATSEVCSLPRQVFPNTPFANLGGGRWGKWSDTGGELDYACEGGTDSINLKKDGNADITAEYTVLGNAQNAHYITAEYTSFQYTGQTVAENTLRQRYADFCDRLASKLYGKTLSKEFRNRILNESTYSPAGKANQHPEKIGTGYISVSSYKNKTMVMLNVRFFPSEADYRTYKDS